MSFLRWLGFVFSFACSNVWNRPALRTTLANLATVLGIVAISVMAIGLTLGNEAVEQIELDLDPLNRSLWSGSVVKDLGITEHSVADLHQTLLRRFREGNQTKWHLRILAALGFNPGSRPGEDPTAACFPFSETEFVWIHQDGRSVRRSTGRTILPDDPMLQSRELRSGKRDFLPDGTDGIVAAAGLLQSLGYDPDNPPASIDLEPPRGGGRRPVALLGVTKEPPPLDHLFVMSDGFERRLRFEEPNPSLAEIRTPPLPDGWPATDQLPESLLSLMSELQLLAPQEEKFSPSEGVKARRWLLSHNGLGQNPSLSQWKLLLDRIATHLENRVGGENDRERLDRVLKDFCRPVFNSTESVPVRERYDFVGVYVKEYRHLPIVEEEIQKLGWPMPDPDYLRRYLSIVDQTEKTLKTLVLIGFLTALVAAVNLWVIQFLWNEQKSAETGMLKAMGMGHGTLSTLAVAEGAVLWLCATTPGLVCGVVFGRLVSHYNRHAAGPQASELGFFWSIPLCLAIAAVSGLMCVLSSYVAGGKARRQSPCESLRG
ncbi:MAG: ABC transporter permease [Planctomycetaceae bacterium]|nr:ABC transporter permease [Planctomycetaceae bacterium]